MALKYVVSLPDVLPNGPCKIYIDDTTGKWYGEDDNNVVSLLSTEDPKFKNLGEYAFYLEASQVASEGYVDLTTRPSSKISVYDITNEVFLFEFTPPEITNFKNANEMLILRNKSGCVDIFICHQFDIQGGVFDSYLLKLTNVRVDVENNVLIYDAYQNLLLTGYGSIHGYDFDEDFLYLSTRWTEKIAKVNRYGTMSVEPITYTLSGYTGSDNLYSHKKEVLMPVYGPAPNYKQMIIAIGKYGTHTERKIIDTINESGTGSVNWPSPFIIDSDNMLYYFIGGDTRSTQIVKFNLTTETEVSRLTFNHPIKNIGSGAGVTRFKGWMHAMTIHDNKLYATTSRNPLLFIFDLSTFTLTSSHILTDAQTTETTIYYGSFGGEETGYLSDDLWVQGRQLFICSEMMIKKQLVYNISSGTPVLVASNTTTYDNYCVAFVNDGNKLNGLEASSLDSGNFSGKINNFRIATEKTSGFTAVSGYMYPLNLSGGPFTVDPPASPSSGDTFKITDSRSISVANNATIDFITAGHKFHGATANDLLNSAGDTIAYIYINSTIGWIRDK